MKSKLLLFFSTLLAFITSAPLLSAEDAAVPAQPGAVTGQVSSWEKPATAPVQGTSAVSPSSVVASGELAGGEKVEITELKRTSGDTVTLKFKLINTGNDELSVGPLGDGDWYNWDLARIFLLDLPNKKKYFVLRDSENQALCSKGTSKIKPGAQLALWAKFPAPPTTVDKITVEIPGAAPFEDLTISN